MKDKTKKQHNLEVGDILKCAWGYGQINIDFYKVVEVLGKTKIKICGMNKKIENRYPNHYDLVQPIEKAEEKNLEPHEWGSPLLSTITLTTKYVKNNEVKITTSSKARKWNGEPCQQTNPFYGNQ